jgi:hypothetical protein
MTFAGPQGVAVFLGANDFRLDPPVVMIADSNGPGEVESNNFATKTTPVLAREPLRSDVDRDVSGKRCYPPEPGTCAWVGRQREAALLGDMCVGLQRMSASVGPPPTRNSPSLDVAFHRSKGAMTRGGAFFDPIGKCLRPPGVRNPETHDGYCRGIINQSSLHFTVAPGGDE